MKHPISCVVITALSLVLPMAAQVAGSHSTRFGTTTAVNVTTWHNDMGRTGLNPSESALNPGNVNKSQFGKICSAIVDGQVYAQPLVMSNVNINGQLYPSVVYVVTQNDSVYAFDGASSGPACTQLLFINLLPPGEFPVACQYFGGKRCGAINPAIGILGTPVIDPTSNVLYLVAQSQVGNPPTSWIHRIHALNITNFDEVFNGPAVISGTYRAVTFSSSTHIQRPGLLLLPGSPKYVYAAFSLIDGLKNNPPSGWIFRFDAQNVSAKPTVFATAPAEGGAGIWQGGAGPAAGTDSAGGKHYVYFGTADGAFDADARGGSDYGDSFVKLTTDLSTVEGYFTPYNQACMQENDLDFGSGGVVLIPAGVIPAHPYLAVEGDKEGSIYVIDLGDPGGYGGTGNCLGSNSNVQTLTGLQLIHNTPAYWNKNLFIAPTSSGILKYTIGASCSPGPICNTPVASTVTFQAGATPSISVNGNSKDSAIVWALWGDGYRVGGPPAVLYAFNPLNMTELYGSNQCGTQDVPGAAIKFSLPTIANGRVFIGTQTDFDIYGEFPTSRKCP